MARNRSAAELEALANQGAELLGENATAQEVVAWVKANFATETTAVACSMADSVLPAVVAEQLPGVDVLFLDTGYHFVETYATRNEVALRLPVTVVDIKPKQTVAEQDAQYGEKLYSRDPGLCCQLRKVDPLHESLGNYELWFTGVRREEALTRTATPLVVWDSKNNLVKVNPLAAWTFDELVGFAVAKDVPVNLLLTNGYPSIGCEPCTKAVAPGEDPRSGRWAGLDKTECGLHVD